MAHPSLGPGSHGRRRERNLQTSPTRSPGRARDVYHDAAAAAAICRVYLRFAKQIPWTGSYEALSQL